MSVKIQRLEAPLPADRVDCLETSGRYQPCARIFRKALARPLLERRAERFVQCFFGKVEVAEQANQRGEHGAGFGAINRLDFFGCVLVHQAARISRPVRCARTRAPSCSGGAAAGAPSAD